MTKAQKRQSAKDKALNGAGLEAPAAGAPPGGRAPRAKAKAKANGAGNAKTSAPHGVCFEYWDQGKCAKGDACKWDHVKSTDPGAAGYIAKAKAAARAREQAAPANGATPKAKSKTVCKFFELGKCDKGKSCEYSHAGGRAAPAAEPKKKGVLRAQRSTTFAAAVESEDEVAGAGLVTFDEDSDSS